MHILLIVNQTFFKSLQDLFYHSSQGSNCVINVLTFNQLCSQVNGKPYPQAKLELGKMGALHPANRLAAYITGRICPVSQPVTTSTTAKALTAVPVTSVATVTSVTSTSPASTTTSPIKTAGKSTMLTVSFYCI